jgi:hypothetical protein
MTQAVVLEATAIDVSPFDPLLGVPGRGPGRRPPIGGDVR